LYYIHVLHPKETIYSLSKFTNTSVQEIYDLNGINKQSVLAIGQKLRIPINTAQVLKSKTSLPNHQAIKVFYRVKKKDNLFQITKRYFQTDINTVMKLNQLHDLTLSPGQLLHIGWMLAPNNVTIERIETEQAPTEYINAPAVVVSKPTYERNSQQSAIENVVTEVPMSSSHVKEEVKTSYRVVQHTPLSRYDSTTAKEENLSKTTQVPVTAAPVNKAPVSQTVTYKEEAEIAADHSTQVVNVETVQYSTPADAPPAHTNKPIATTTETVINKEESSVTVKTREYPDLSFLSDPSLQVEKAVASWDQSDNEPLNMFVLHHSAKLNSYVRIENPMLGRIALAKVIGRLPNNIKDSQVKMIVSTAVANSLGVKDDKFLTEIKFIR